MTDYLCGTVSDGVSGKVSVMQIWNEPGSGVEFVVDVIDLAWATTGPNYNAMLKENTPLPSPAFPNPVSIPVYQGFDMNWFDQPIGAGNPNNRRLVSCVPSMTASTCPIEMQADAWAAPYPSSVLFHEGWKQTIGDMKRFPFKRAPRIQPGFGLLIRSALNYCWTIVNVQGHTEAV